ncbi:hypothetical protein [Longimicrobium sp.]|uniref:hypothetical protein n=1 Tax=Longimicrobium sp. TaxID=2029185 RepID=UPI002F95E492
MPKIIAELQNGFGNEQVHRKFALQNVPRELDGCHREGFEGPEAVREHLQQPPRPSEAVFRFGLS